jgi:uncharacterized protein (TIRG00374 family)
MSGEAIHRKRNRILSWLVNLAGVLAFALILYWGGAEAWRQMIRVDGRYLLAAFAAMLSWNLVAAYRWSLLADRVAGRTVCPYRYYFTYHMIGMVTGQVLPITVGMLGGRPVALSLSQGVPLKRTGLSVLLDKLFDLLLALLLVGPVALYLVGWIRLPLSLGLMGFAVIAGALVLFWRYEQVIRQFGQFGARLARALGRVPVLGAKFARRVPQQLERLSAEAALSNRLAVQTYLLTLVLYSLLAARLILISHALRLDIPSHLLAMGACVTQLAVVFSVTPGSLGFLEGGWAAVLGLAGLTRDQFTFFVIGRRAYALVFTLLCALLAFAWIRESPARLFRAVITASRQTDREPAPVAAQLQGNSEGQP